MTTHLAHTSGVVGVLLACTLPLGAQTPQPRGQFVDSVKIEVVNVEVYVTDRDGHPVPGLSIADFELLEDGKPVKLSNFYVGDGFVPVSPPTPDASEEEDSPPEESPAPRDENQALHLVVLVDDVNIKNAGRNAAIEAVATAIETRLRPGDDVMIALYHFIGLGLEVRCPLTTDLAKTAAALRAITKIGSQGQFFGADRINLLDRPPRSSASSGKFSRGDEEEKAAVRDAQQIESESKASMLGRFNSELLAKTAQLVESLAGLAGRKALVLVSEGIPTSMVFNELETRLPTQALSTTERNRHDFDSAVVGLGTRANAGRVTFYPVVATLYRGLEGISAEDSHAPADANAASMASLDQSLSLHRLAEGTGGQALSNSVDLEAHFGNVLASLDAFYSLGFVNPHPGDGTYHRLTVKVSRDGLKLRYREGYLDKPESVRQTDRTAAALLKSGRANLLGLEADTGPAVPGQDKTLKVPLTVSLQGSAITVLPAEKGKSGRVSVLVARADNAGHLTAVHREEFTIPVATERLEAMRQQRLVFTFDVIVAAGDTTLAVTARDELGQVESTITLGVTAGPPAGS